MTHAERNPPRHGFFTVFLAFAGGALLGGVAALLLAPRSGAETRRRIGGAAGGARDLAAAVPRALHDASRAARAAYTSAMENGASVAEVPPRGNS